MSDYLEGYFIPMQIKVLGCSGGLGNGLQTTSLLVDEDILIDAGTGVGELTLEEMEKIRHVFLTHSHLDHIASIPLLLDSLFDRIQEPILLHGRPETLQALQDHVFNWVIWPDFSKLPTPRHSLLRYAPMHPGESWSLNGRTVEMVEVNHVVPAAGYCVSNGEHVFAYSGDTTTNDTFWARLNAYARLDVLVVEVAFPNRDLALSHLARHYCPELLAADLAKLQHQPEIYLSHLKPGDEETILDECRDALDGHNIHRLRGGEIFRL